MLTRRQELILSLVVKEYTKTAEPVGSGSLFNEGNLEISSATIRNELAFLEEEGFLYQPHTSAGRVPTDKGYRFFVNSLMKDRELSRGEQILLQEELLKLKAKNLRLAKTTAKLLGVLSRNLAISGLIEEEEYFQSGVKGLLSQPEFSEVDEICKTIEILDYLDENMERLKDQLDDGEVKTLIGKENPLIKTEGCSLVVSKIKLPNGQNGIVAIMGPKRMEYAKNISLVKYVTGLLK